MKKFLDFFLFLLFFPLSHVWILVRYDGTGDGERRKYEGGMLKSIVVSKEITHKDLYA